MENLIDLFKDQIKDLYSAESQLVKALPKMIKRASDDHLRDALSKHLKETEEQMKRLTNIGEILDFKPIGKKCKAMEGLIEEASEILKEEGNPNVLDAALIAAAQRVEHYEIAAYGTACAIAKVLEENEVFNLLEKTLSEESNADKKLSEVVENNIYPSLITIFDDEDDQDTDETVNA